VTFVGLQASGKSSFFRERFAATHEHVSKDLLRNTRNRSRRQAQLIEAALGAGSSVVVDNTNPTVEDRRAPIRLGRKLDAKVIGYYFESTVRECVERNRRRTGR
jgi:predicted kinase